MLPDEARNRSCEAVAPRVNSLVQPGESYQSALLSAFDVVIAAVQHFSRFSQNSRIAPFHGGLDLIGEDLLDRLFLAAFQNALRCQKLVNGRANLLFLLLCGPRQFHNELLQNWLFPPCRS
jgi:hypothetical protein